MSHLIWGTCYKEQQIINSIGMEIPSRMKSIKKIDHCYLIIWLFVLFNHVHVLMVQKTLLNLDIN